MKNKIILLFLSTILLGACDYLDYDEKNYLTEDDIYSNLSFAEAALTNVYRYLPTDFTSVGNAMLSSACDESFFANDASAVHKFNNGSWSAIQTLDAKWGHYYTGIRAVNNLLEETANYSYDDYRFDKDPTFEELMQILTYHKAEARALRAFFYFELAKRYGDVPLITEVLTEEQANNVVRMPFDSVITYIVSECDSAASILPATYDTDDDRYKQTGRVTKGAAMAIKARALLYAASPLHNVGNDIEKWKLAAAASHDIIELGTYSLNSNYLLNFNNYSSTNKELIFEVRAGVSNTFEKINFPVGYEGGSSGNCPTQNLVDAYEIKKTGLGIHEEGSGYDPENPFSGRDTRFAMSILYNGAKYKGQVIEVFEGGNNGAPIRYASPTGYYLRKYVDETITLDAGNVTSKEHTWVLFRYASVLLDYAEAMSEAYGVSEKGDFTLSAEEAVNQLRSKRRMKTFPAGLSPDAFETKLRNERRVELAFEGHRFWDVRRWKIGSENDIRGIKVTTTEEEVSYSYQTIETRTYEEKMNLYPIPFDEVIINPGLGQNPGW